MAALNNEKPKSSQIILEQEGKFCTGKQAANILVRLYAETSDLQIPTDRKREIKEEQHAGPDHQEEPRMNSLLPTRNQRMLEQCWSSKRPLVLTTQQMRRSYIFGPCKKKLLQLFNDGWRTGIEPKSGEKPSWFLYSRESKTSQRLKATDQSALPVVWENWSTTLSTHKAANTGETKNITSFSTAGPLKGETELQDHMP